jgi:[protein-PII] uridylyltransferase
MEFLRPAAFAFHKHQERREGWAKFGNSVYVLEPNLKEGVGGLRDFQAAGWIARARYHLRSDLLWQELRGQRLLTDPELDELLESREFLLRVRHQLHLLVGRQNDSLTADRQEAVAERLGFTADGEGVPVVRFMRRVYESMAVLHRTYRRISEVCLEGPLPLDRRLILKRNRIHATDRDLLEDDSSSLTRVFHHFQEFGFRPDHDLEEMIGSAVRRGSPALQPAALSPLLMSLLTGERAAPAMRLMDDLGVLEIALPEEADCRTLTPLNLVHKYTVGEHSLRALELLEDLPFNVDTDLAELRRIYTLVERPEILRLALLLHDVGKAVPERNHAETGAMKARQAGERLGLDDFSRELLEFLVLHHQLMSETAQLRDLTQDQTMRDFCAIGKDVRQLRLLYLLTYADMKATGPGIWTAVASRFLEELYHRAEAALMHGLPDTSSDPDLLQYRRRMRRELSYHNLPTEEVEAHCALMPASSLLNTPLDEIAAHVRAMDRLKNENPSIDFFPGPGGQATMLTICAYEDPEPGLLSKIAAVLYANDVEVHAAQVYTRQGEPQIAIDTLWTQFHGGEVPPVKRRDVEKDLTLVLSGQATAADLLKKRGKRVPATIIPRIEVRNDLSEGHSVVEVDAADTRGLLLRVTRAMSKVRWDIHSARVSTLDGEARDAFYVTDAQGEKLPLDSMPLILQILEDAAEESVALDAKSKSRTASRRK